MAPVHKPHCHWQRPQRAGQAGHKVKRGLCEQLPKTNELKYDVCAVQTAPPILRCSQKSPSQSSHPPTPNKTHHRDRRPVGPSSLGVPPDDHEKWMSGGGIRQWAKQRKRRYLKGDGREDAVISRAMGWQRQAVTN